MTAEEGARPRFKRAIERRNLWGAEDAARELPKLTLEEAYAGEDDAEFVLRTRRGTPLSRHNGARTIREAGEDAKLGHVTPHVLRRTTGTALSEARVPERPRR